MEHKLQTKNGYCYYEATSAFQKSIRRSIEDETIFWGIELYDSGYIPHLWNRIMIIAHEDIGLAEDNFTSKIIALKYAHDYLAEKRPQKVSKKLVMLQTFILLANAKKSRYIDLAYSVHWAKHDEIAQTKEIPDYALDMHTKRGKQLGRGLDHFYNSSTMINNANKMPLENIYEEMARMIDIELLNKPKPAQKNVQPQNNGINPQSSLFD